MAIKKRGLGRGLEALLGGSLGAPEAEGTAAPAPESDTREGIDAVAVDLIDRSPFQPRREFDPAALQELADSIAAQGVIQPVVVRPRAGGRFELIAGERRWRASQLAGLHEIPVVIREVPDQAAMAIALIENIQREDLNPLEEATALQRLLGEFGLTHQEIAEAVGKSRTMVTNLLRLLELNDDVKGYLEQKRLEMGHARALLGLKGALQSDAARRVVEQGLSVRETEKLVRRLQQEGEAAIAKKSTPPEDPDIRALREDLADRLGAKVEIQQGGGGKGKLVIAYNSLDELDGILQHIR